ncbi:MAG: hypothetical protein PHE54_03785 [Bacilli bacterium]|nr:hypothetical protein [Bacilli bacterium]
MATALLHDIGLFDSGIKRYDHGIIGSKIFRNFITNTNITAEEAKIMEHAIADHSNGDATEATIDAALVLADKLDITYHRTEN